MGSKGLWLALIPQFDYPIRAARAAADADADGDVAAAAGVFLLLEGTGALFRSGVTQEREPQRHTNAHTHALHNSCLNTIMHDLINIACSSGQGRVPKSSALLAAPSWIPGPWQAWLGLLRGAGRSYRLQPPS
eukprot:1150870-Pelagomonas_calceolata.AAC.9